MTGRLVTQGSWPATPASVPAARRLVRAHLLEQGQPELLPSAELLISELVTNVVLHVGGEVDVTASLDGDVLTVEVRDGSPHVPLVRAFSETSSTGRGMRLVHSLSAEHGVRHDDHGKTIWARVTPRTAARRDVDLAESFAVVDWLSDVEEDDGPALAPGNGAGVTRLRLFSAAPGLLAAA